MKQGFSIVIPVYNAATTLDECLASVVRQTHGQFEVILIDDGSTDHSASIVNHWQPKMSQRLKFIRQPNRGLGAARNRGVAEAEMDWIAFLDADDYWRDNKLSVMNQYLSGADSEVYYHAVTNIGLKQSRKRAIHPIKTCGDFFRMGNPIVPSAVVISRELMQAHRFSEKPGHHGCEDLELWLRLVAEGRRFRVVPENLGYYRESGGMSSDLSVHLQHVHNVLKDLYEESILDDRLLTEARYRKDYEAARFYHKRGQHREAAAYYGKAGFRGLKSSVLRLLNLLRWRL